MTLDELNKVSRIRQRILDERRRLESLRMCADSTTRILDGLPHVRSLTSRPERITVEITECERRLSELAGQLDDEAVKLATRINSEIKSSLVASVLTLSFVSCMKVNQIAAKLHFTYEHIRKLRVRGVKELTGHDVSSKRA